MKTTTCSHCGKPFSYDDGIFATGPKRGSGFFDSYICSVCAHEQGEGERHGERQRAEEQRHSEEMRRSRDSEQDAERRHQESLDVEMRRQEAEERRLEAEERRREAEYERLEAEERRHREHIEIQESQLHAQGKAILESARELVQAGLFDDALKSALRAQEILGFTPEVGFVKLTVAREAKKPALSASIIATIVKLLNVESIHKQHELDNLTEWIRLLADFDKSQAEKAESHIQAILQKQELARQEAQRQADLLAEAEARAALEAAAQKERDDAEAAAIVVAKAAAKKIVERREQKITLIAVFFLVIAGIIAWFYLTRENTAAKPQATLSVAPTTTAPVSSAEKVENIRPNGSTQPSVRSHNQSIQIPDVRSGDTWTFSVVSQQDSKSGYSLRRTVLDVSATEMVVEALNLSNSKAQPRRLTYDRAWGSKDATEANGSRREYSPPIEYFNFPLEPGKTWTNESSEVGASKIFKVSGTVVGWESIQTSAGSFDALKIILKSENFEDGQLISEATDTSWFAPEAKRSVRSEESAHDIRNGKSSTRTIDLTSFRVSK